MKSARPAIHPHIVRYGTPADQEFLLGKFQKTYDQLVLNATMVAHMPGALASFVSRRAKGKPYFIDPQTHAFQHDISYLESGSESKKGEIKRSVRKLLEAYGEPVLTRVGKRRESVLPGDFKGERSSQFCANVLRFQLETFRKEIEESDSAKYYAYLKEESVPFEHPTPSLVVAPYFHLTASTVSEWLPVNLKFIKDSRPATNGVALAAEIVISQDLLLNPALRATLVNEYVKANPDAFLVWVDDLSEAAAPVETLKSFTDFLGGLGKSHPVANLYGGFLSVALMRASLVPGLKGVSHGLEYGEERGVVPVGGGVPVSKFYLPALHKRLAFRDAVRAVRGLGGMTSVKRYFETVCDCQGCRAIILTNPEVDFAAYGASRPVSFMRRAQLVALEYPLPETKKRSVAHYMWCKHREYTGSFDATATANELTETKKYLSRVLGLGNVAHCESWSKVLAPPASSS